MKRECRSVDRESQRGRPKIDTVMQTNKVTHGINDRNMGTTERKVETQKYAFGKGYERLRFCDAPEAERKLMKAINVKTRQSFLVWKNGYRMPSVQEKEDIEKVFAEYGIPAEDVWGMGNGLMAVYQSVRRKG